MSRFAAFLDSAVGEALIATERNVLERLLPSLLRYNLLQLSVQRGESLCDESRLGQYLRMGFAPAADSDNDDSIWADYQAFPVASDCFDTVLLHHVLEFASDPHQVLREASRVLTEGGNLLVVGCNPMSLWTPYRRFWEWRHATALGQQPVAAGRLAEWFSLLDFDVLHSQSYFYRPPVSRRLWLDKLTGIENVGERFRLPGGMVYVMLARKRAAPMNPLYDAWLPGLRRGKVSGAQANTVCRRSVQYDLAHTVASTDNDESKE